MKELSDVSQVIMGQAPPSSSYNKTGDGLPLVAGASEFGFITPKTKRYSNAEKLKRSKLGDIILCVRATIGNLNWSDGVYALGRGVCSIRANENVVDKKYLWHFLGASKRHLNSLGRGAIFLQIKKKDIETLKVPLPSLEEQKKTAFILDRANELRTLRTKSIEKLQELERSIFYDMFGDPLDKECKWNVQTLETLTTKITDGVHQKPEYTSNGAPFISVKDITTGELIFDNCKFISEEAHQKYYKRCNPEMGDILYTKVGATYGRPVVVNVDYEFSLYVSVALLKPKKELIDPYFLNAVLALPSTRRQADRAIKGIGVPDLHLKEIKKFKIIVPPMNLQKLFLAKLEALHSLRKKLQKELLLSNNLFNSLLQKAFKGELKIDDKAYKAYINEK